MDKIRLLKAVDRIVGTPLVHLCSLFASGRDKKSVQPERLLFVRPGGIGDAVLLLPAVAAFKRVYPQAVIDILCEKRNAGVFMLSADISRVYCYDRGIDLFRCLRNTYDAAIDTEQWHRLSAVVTFLTGAPVRIGFDTNDRGLLFTHKTAYSHDDYEAESFLNLLNHLLSSPVRFRPDIPFVDVSPFAMPAAFIESPERRDRMVALFPGASVQERKWGGERFGEVASLLYEKGFGVLILGSVADREEAARIRDFAPHAIDLTGKTSLAEAAMVLHRCRLLISADSGLLHIAVSVGTPTVSLFGSGIEKKWAPRGGLHRVITSGLPCSPCTRFGYTPHCNNAVRCLSEITATRVTQAAEEILSRSVDKESA